MHINLATAIPFHEQAAQSKNKPLLEKKAAFNDLVWRAVKCYLLIVGLAAMSERMSG